MLGFLQAGLLSTVSSRCNSTMYKKREAFSVRCFYALSKKHSVCSLGRGMQRCPLISVCMLCSLPRGGGLCRLRQRSTYKSGMEWFLFNNKTQKLPAHIKMRRRVWAAARARRGRISIGWMSPTLKWEISPRRSSVYPIPHYGVSDNAPAGPMAGDRTRARVFLTSLNQLNSLKYAIIWHFLCCCRNEFLLVELGPSRVPSDLVMT